MVSLPLGLVTSIILARVLGPSGFGNYAFIMSFVPLLALPITHGSPALLLREVASLVRQSNWNMAHGAINAAQYWAAGVSLFAGTVYLVFGPLLDWLPSSGKWSLLGGALFLVPLHGFIATKSAVLKGLRYPARAEMPTQIILPAVFLVIILVFMYCDGLTEEQAIWGQVIASGTALVVAALMLFKFLPGEVARARAQYQLSDWGRALLPFTLMTAVGVMNARIGVVLVGLVGDSESVAGMRVAERGAQLVGMSLMFANIVISPYFVRAWQEGNRHKLQNFAKWSARVACVTGIPLAAVLFFFGEPLIGLAFGDEYVALAYQPLVILLAGQCFNLFFGSVGQLLVMSNNENYTLFGQVVALVANVVLGLALIPQYGAVGAAVGVTAGLIIWNGLLAYLVVRKLGIRPSVV